MMLRQTYLTTAVDGTLKGISAKLVVGFKGVGDCLVLLGARKREFLSQAAHVSVMHRSDPSAAGKQPEWSPRLLAKG